MVQNLGSRLVHDQLVRRCSSFVVNTFEAMVAHELSNLSLTTFLLKDRLIVVRGPMIALSELRTSR